MSITKPNVDDIQDIHVSSVASLGSKTKNKTIVSNVKNTFHWHIKDLSKPNKTCQYRIIGKVDYNVVLFYIRLSIQSQVLIILKEEGITKKNVRTITGRQQSMFTQKPHLYFEMITEASFLSYSYFSIFILVVYHWPCVIVFKRAMQITD